MVCLQYCFQEALRSFDGTSIEIFHSESPVNLITDSRFTILWKKCEKYRKNVEYPGHGYSTTQREIIQQT